MDVRARRTASYAGLVRSGAIGSMKRDVLLEAERDLVYVTTVHHEFTQAGEAARADAIANTVQLIEELIASGHCRLATWGIGTPQHRLLDEDTQGIHRLVERGVQDRHCVWEVFLVATPESAAWVRQYIDLVENFERGLASGPGAAAEGAESPEVP